MNSIFNYKFSLAMVMQNLISQLMAPLLKYTQKCKNSNDLGLCKCACHYFAHAKHGCTGGWLVLYKRDVKCWNTLSCLDQYMCRGLRLWNSWDREAVYVYKYVHRMEAVRQSGPWSSLGSHGCYQCHITIAVIYFLQWQVYFSMSHQL